MFSSSRMSLRRARHHDAPGLEQVGVVGEIERERGVLLDQQHAHLLVAVERAQDAEQLLARSAARARTKARRAASGAAQHQRAADRQHLLLAARERAGLLAAALLQAREIAVDALDVGGDRRRGRAASWRRAAGSPRRSGATNVPRPCGTCAMPSRTMSSVARPAIALAVEADLAARCAPCRRARAASWSCRRRSRRAAS